MSQRVLWAWPMQLYPWHLSMKHALWAVLRVDLLGCPPDSNNKYALSRYSALSFWPHSRCHYWYLVAKRLTIHFGIPIGRVMHRPHSRQVTGARCTGGRGSPVMSWILPKANNGQQTSGVGDKRFFRFKRNAYHLWTAIIRHRLNDIIHQQVMRFNQRSKFAIIFKVHLKHPQCFGTLAQPSYFLSNTPVMIQRIFTGPARANTVINTIYGTGDPALVDMWRTSHQNMKYQSSLRRRVITGGSQKDVRVSRRMDCRIGVIKFHVSAKN